MRNVRVGCRDEGENAGFSGTQGQPAEFCQEKHGAVFLARAMGVRDEGRGQKSGRGKKVRVGVAGKGEEEEEEGQGFPGALPWGTAKRCIRYDKA